MLCRNCDILPGPGADTGGSHHPFLSHHPCDRSGSGHLAVRRGQALRLLSDRCVFSHGSVLLVKVFEPLVIMPMRQRAYEGPLCVKSTNVFACLAKCKHCVEFGA